MVGRGFRIRPARGNDAPQIARLFFQTVHRVNARDYSPDQIAAWAPPAYSDAHWQRRLRQDYSLVAERGGEVLGFAILDRSIGYLDSFFVHHRHQGRGIGRALMDGIEKAARRAGLQYLVTDASLTAEPFFRAVGFRRVRRQKRFYRGQVFRQYRMSKILR
jgi:putative acetyltransferase